MESSNPQFEIVLNRVREQLNAEKVKLSLPPFTAENGEAGKYPQDLVMRYSSKLQISADVIAEALETLRTHALEKLASQKRFTESGIAVIKVHLAGDIPPNTNNKLQISSTLHVSGKEFKQRLGSEISLDPGRLKLISSGRVIEDDKPLQLQSVKNNSLMMAILLSESEAESQKKQQEAEAAAANVTRTRQAAEALSKRTDGGHGRNEQYFVEINDQEGRPLQLPDSERKALVVAMALHERGRSVLDQKKYAEALVLLLEADKEFSLCRAQILQAVDNYAILCLDIVWCYLWLKSIMHLPSAEEKLAKCKECFERSYGKNLERLMAVRGGSGRELALFVRLHILEAATAYHRGRLQQASALVHQAEEEMKRLHIDDNKLTQLVCMGFSVVEARLSLRACNSDVTLAVEHVTRRRQEKEERKRKEKQERDKRNLERKLGRTASGDWVNVDHYKALLNMGFPETPASRALRQANNDMNGALQILHDHPELLFLEDSGSSTKKLHVPEELVAQLFSLGFDLDVSRRALTQFHGDIQRATDLLLASGGVLPSSSAEGQSSASLTDHEEENQEDPDVEAAVRELVPTLAQDEDEAHLDLTLEEESAVISEYKALLLSTGWYKNHAGAS